MAQGCFKRSMYLSPTIPVAVRCWTSGWSRICFACFFRPCSCALCSKRTSSAHRACSGGSAGVSQRARMWPRVGPASGGACRTLASARSGRRWTAPSSMPPTRPRVGRWAPRTRRRPATRETTRRARRHPPPLQVPPPGSPTTGGSAAAAAMTSNGNPQGGGGVFVAVVVAGLQSVGAADVGVVIAATVLCCMQSWAWSWDG
mmetsp:Transcript_82811/g.237879  ORF Transcript_82811/g.237879 Transcript_82811/m.237879 type:complete len:202 (-) Transcript_82811:236-841(-)